MNEQTLNIIKSLDYEKAEREIQEQQLYNNFMLIVRYERDNWYYEMFEKPKTKQIFNILDFMSL
jgi:hypothetical protein